jgi:hypothetical protein
MKPPATVALDTARGAPRRARPPSRSTLEQAGLPLDESPEYQTLAGFVPHTPHAVPQLGAAVTANGYVWTVVDMKGARVAKVTIEPVSAAGGSPSVAKPGPSRGPQSQ